MWNMSSFKIFIILRIECSGKSIFPKIAARFDYMAFFFSDSIERELNFATNQASDAICIEKYGIAFFVADSKNEIFEWLELNNRIFRCNDDALAIRCKQIFCWAKKCEAIDLG